MAGEDTGHGPKKVVCLMADFLMSDFWLDVDRMMIKKCFYTAFIATIKTILFEGIDAILTTVERSVANVGAMKYKCPSTNLFNSYLTIL